MLENKSVNYVMAHPIKELHRIRNCYLITKYTVELMLKSNVYGFKFEDIYYSEEELKKLNEIYKRNKCKDLNAIIFNDNNANSDAPDWFDIEWTPESSIDYADLMEFYRIKSKYDTNWEKLIKKLDEKSNGNVLTYADCDYIRRLIIFKKHKIYIGEKLKKKVKAEIIEKDPNMSQDEIEKTTEVINNYIEKKFIKPELKYNKKFSYYCLHIIAIAKVIAQSSSL